MVELTRKMQKGFILINSLFSTLNSLPAGQPNIKKLTKRATGISDEDKNFYGSWDWFIDQIAKENEEAAPTETVWTTPPPVAPKPRFRSFGTRSGMSRYGNGFGNKVNENRQDNRQDNSQDNSQDRLLDDKFAWFSGRPKPTPKPQVQQPIRLQSRSGPGFFESFGLSKNELGLDSLLETNRPFESVQFLPNSDRNAIMYNSFEDIGSGEDPYTQDRYTSFEVEKKKNKNPIITGNNYEKPSSSMFTFHTNVPNTHFDPSQIYQQTRVEDNTLLPVMLTQEWPSNDNALGGAIFEVMNFIFGNTGTCFIRLPVAVYWFHVFNAHIDPTESDPSSGTYALIAANQAFEGVSTLDFIVNFIGDDYRFDAGDIELSCDSANTWTTSLLSFPGNTLGDVGRTNVRSVDGFEGKKVVIQFIYDVENFYVDDRRLTVDPPTGAGNTFTISDLTGTLLEEVWFGWTYVPGGWFSAADVLVGYFDQN